MRDIIAALSTLLRALAPIMPFYVCLDYTAVRVGLDAEGIPVTPELWQGLRVMEREACAALARNEPSAAVTS